MHTQTTIRPLDQHTVQLTLTTDPTVRPGLLDRLSLRLGLWLLLRSERRRSIQPTTDEQQRLLAVARDRAQREQDALRAYATLGIRH